MLGLWRQVIFETQALASKRFLLRHIYGTQCLAGKGWVSNTLYTLCLRTKNESIEVVFSNFNFILDEKDPTLVVIKL